MKPPTKHIRTGTVRDNAAVEFSTFAGKFPYGIYYNWETRVPANYKFYWTSSREKWVTKPDIGDCDANGYEQLDVGHGGYLCPNARQGCVVAYQPRGGGSGGLIAGYDWSIPYDEVSEWTNNSGEEYVINFAANDILEAPNYADNSGWIRHMFCITPI